MDVEIECPFAGPLFAVGYIFLQTGIRADDAFPYKATFVALGNGISPRSLGLCRHFSSLNPLPQLTRHEKIYKLSHIR